MEKLVIIGNGIAGQSVLQEVLKGDQEYDITVVYKEDPRVYLRTQIIDYATGDLPEDRFFMTKEGFYEEKGVKAIKATVISMDGEKKILGLDQGDTLTYDKLVIATGAYPFVPPVKVLGHSKLKTIDSTNISGIDGVYSIRNLKDAESFNKKLATAKKAVVIGAGLLGLEACDALIDKGLEVTVVEFAPRILPRQLDRDSADCFQHTAEEFGLTFITGDSAKEIIFDHDEISKVSLVSGKQLEADLVLFSIGVRSDVAPFVGQLNIERGIVIDEYGQTSLPGVYAVGDAAQDHGMVYGTWTYAMSSGKTVGKNLAGSTEKLKPYTLFTLFNSLNVKIFSAGMVDFEDPSLQVHESGNREEKSSKLFFKDQKLVAGILMGDTAKGPVLSKAIDANMPYDEAVENFAIQ